MNDLDFNYFGGEITLVAYGLRIEINDFSKLSLQLMLILI